MQSKAEEQWRKRKRREKKKNERESASHHKGQTRKGHIWEYEKVNIFDVGKVT